MIYHFANLEKDTTVGANEENRYDSISNLISHYINGQTKKAYEFVTKAAADVSLLTRVVEEYREGWWTFHKDDDAIWFFGEVLRSSNNESIKKLALEQLIIARNTKALKAINSGDEKQAKKILLESVFKKLDDEYTHLFYAVALRKDGLIKEADIELGKFFELNPDNDYDIYAFFLHRAGLDKEAKRFFDKVLESPKKPIDTYRLYINYLKETDQFKKVIEFCEKVIQLDPHDPHTFHDYAFAVANLGRHAEAIEYLWKCINNAEVLDENIPVTYNDLNRTVHTKGKENFKRMVAREICSTVTFTMNSSSTEEIEKIKRYFPKDYYWTLFYNGCIRYIRAKNYWYNREWDLADEAFYRAHIRFDMADELGALGQTLIVWRLFSVDRGLNELFKDIEYLERATVLEKLHKLSESMRKISRQDSFGRMMNGYAESLAYLNNLLEFFKDAKEVKIDYALIPRVMKAFAENDFVAGFDILDIIRKIEKAISRGSTVLAESNYDAEKRRDFFDNCWREIITYLTSALMALNGQSIYEIVRNSEKQPVVSELLKKT